MCLHQISFTRHTPLTFSSQSCHLHSCIWWRHVGESLPCGGGPFRLWNSLPLEASLAPVFALLPQADEDLSLQAGFP